MRNIEKSENERQDMETWILEGNGAIDANGTFRYK